MSGARPFLLLLAWLLPVLPPARLLDRDLPAWAQPAEGEPEEGEDEDDDPEDPDDIDPDSDPEDPAEPEEPDLDPAAPEDPDGPDPDTDGGSDPDTDGGAETEPDGEAEAADTDDGGGATAADTDGDASEDGDDDGNGTSAASAADGSGEDDADDGDDDADGPAGGAASGGSGGAGGASDDDDDDDDDADDARGPAAGGGAGPPAGDDDDDDDADDRRAQPARGQPPGSGGGGGGDSEPAGPADDAVEAAPLQWVPVESAQQRRERDALDRVRADADGYRFRDREYVALDLSPRVQTLLTRAGFRQVATERLGSLGGTVHLLQGPPTLTAEAGLDRLIELAGDAPVAFNHLFDRKSVAMRRASRLPVPQRRSCGCRMGLVDTGVAERMPVLAHVRFLSRAFNGREPVPDLHGTAVASLVGGTQRHPSRETRLLVADVFAGPRGSAGSAFAVVRAIDWLAGQGVPVINLSLAGPANRSVESAVRRAAAAGHVLVAAAGNEGPAAPPAFPAAYPGVVAVTAVDQSGQPYRYANRGAYISFAALGVDVPALDAAGRPRLLSGTSFAAPLVAARIAQRLERPGRAGAEAALAELRRTARDLGQPGPDPVFGQGLIEP